MKREKVYPKNSKRNLVIQLSFSNRVLYSLVALTILVTIGIGVYAATYTASGAGHPYTEISTCAKNQILKMNSAGTAWECATDVDTSTHVSGGIYGVCATDWHNRYCDHVKSPAYCGTSGSYKVCKCPSGYTQVQISDSDTDDSRLYYTCYKN